MMSIGCYGKLPTHGDFISRDILQAFIDPWDQWLQHGMATGEQMLGFDWESIYKSAPIWRFVLSKGAINESQWAGILLPSADKVGRLFPLTIVGKLEDDRQPLEFLFNESEWFQSIEHEVLLALEESVDVDQLMSSVISQNVRLSNSLQMVHKDQLNARSLFIPDRLSPNVPLSLSLLLHPLLSYRFRSYSAWRLGGERVTSPFLISQSMPDAKATVALFDGQLSSRGWQTPVIFLNDDLDPYEQWQDKEPMASQAIGSREPESTHETTTSEVNDYVDSSFTESYQSSQPLTDLGIEDHFFNGAQTTVPEPRNLDDELVDIHDNKPLNSNRFIEESSTLIAKDKKQEEPNNNWFPEEDHYSKASTTELDDLGIEDHFDDKKLFSDK